MALFRAILASIYINLVINNASLHDRRNRVEKLTPFRLPEYRTLDWSRWDQGLRPFPNHRTKIGTKARKLQYLYIAISYIFFE